MRVSEAINSRRSMRVFKNDPVSKADIEWIIANANRAASNGNLQPWKLYVTMGDATSICVIIQVQPISVIFTIPEDTLPSVRKRLAAGASLEVRVFDRSQKNELALGRLDTTDNVIDTTTGTVRLRAVFENADESLFPNQFVNVRLLVDTVTDATVVPIAAIQRGQPGTFVYLVKPDDTVTIRVVELGASDGDRVAITKGLQVGDNVVVDGVDRLRDGAKIRRPGATPRAAAGPPVATAAPDGKAQEQQGQGQHEQGQQGQRRRQQANGGAGLLEKAAACGHDRRSNVTAWA